MKPREPLPERCRRDNGIFDTPMPATYCEHGYLVEGSRHECAQCTEPVRKARKWVAAQDPVKLEADAQALADVRTLDGYGHHETHAEADGAHCLLRHFDECGAQDGYERFEAETPEAARAKAAAWVREQAATVTEGHK